MCYQLVYLVFDFDSEATLRDAARVADMLARLNAEAGYALPEDDNAAAAWDKALKRGQRSVWIAVEKAAGLRLTFSMMAGNWRRMYLSAERNVMNKEENARSLAEAGSLFYQTLAPEYGYGLVALDIQPLPAPFEGDFLPAVIYDYNFFGPRLLARTGGEKVLNAPAWQVTTFEDGGALLQMSPNPLVDRKSYIQHYEQCAGLLGISKFQQGC